MTLMIEPVFMRATRQGANFIVVSFGLVGMKLILRAIVAIPFSAPGTLVIGGMGLFGIGCSILIIAAGICLIRIFKNWIPHFMQKIVKRRRVKRDEKKQ